MRNRRLLPMLLLLLSMPVAWADEASWDVSANVSLETRYFTEDGRWPGQGSRAGEAALESVLELHWRNADGGQRVSFIPYLRWDAVDSQRSLADLHEAYWALETDSLQLLIGANIVFWGVTESEHLVDIVNQTDAVADIDGEDKLGQPMINLAVQRDWGLISLYVMPYFRERTFAGSDGRFRPALPVDTGRPQYESSDGNRHVDLALRYSHYIGDVDLGLSLFRGTSREPRLLPDAGGDRLLPYYDQIAQIGIDLQYTHDAWLWKLEAIARDGVADRFGAAVGGFEYTHYQVGGSAMDVGVLAEYQYDGRADTEPLTIADHDLFLGTRLAFNDQQDTSLLAGAGVDLRTNETYVNIEAERRLGQEYVLELRSRFFSGAKAGDATYALSADDYVQLLVSRYF
jgi:hypothetical protein